MTALGRIRLALSLGDVDLRVFCAATGLDANEARQRLIAALNHAVVRC